MNPINFSWKRGADYLPIINHVEISKDCSRDIRTANVAGLRNAHVRKMDAILTDSQQYQDGGLEYGRKVWKDVGGNQEEIMSAEMFGGYNAEVEESM